jgi:hypothetical protein
MISLSANQLAAPAPNALVPPPDLIAGPAVHCRPHA